MDQELITYTVEIEDKRVLTSLLDKLEDLGFEVISGGRQVFVDVSYWRQGLVLSGPVGELVWLISQMIDVNNVENPRARLDTQYLDKEFRQVFISALADVGIKAVLNRH